MLHNVGPYDFLFQTYPQTHGELNHLQKHQGRYSGPSTYGDDGQGLNPELSKITRLQMEAKYHQ